MNWNRRYAILCVMLCLTGTAAQEGEADGPALTAREAVSIALQRHPRLLEQRERLAEFRALRGQALARALPNLEASASTVRSRDPGLLNSPNFSSLVEGDPQMGFDPSFLRPIPITLYDYRLNVEQTIYAFGRIGAAVDAAGIRQEQIRHEIRAAEVEVAKTAVVALYDLALAEQQVAVLAAEKQAREKQLQQARDFLDIGTGTRLAYLQAKSALSALAPREIQAQGAVEAARVVLNEALGRAPRQPVSAPAGLLEKRELPPLPGLDDLVLRAGKRPDLSAMRTERAALEKESRVWHSNLLPDLKFSGSYGISTVFTGELTNSDFASWNAGVFLDWTFFDGRETQNKVAEIRSQQRQNELREKTRLGEIQRDLVQAVVEYSRARMAAHAAQQAVEVAEETRRVAEANYAWGAATSLDQLQAVQAVSSARFQLLTAVHDLLAASAEIHALVGRLPFEPLLEEAAR